MRPPFRAIALPIIAVAVLIVSGCQDANEGHIPDVKGAAEPGEKTTFKSYGEAMQEKAARAATIKEAGKDKTVKPALAPAPAKTPAEKPKP